ncbi:hypothetical protein [Methanosarcina mazei]|uniref:hypothetical protein n=1 Tax=Methanosarcina mazei TaxID=2209 RepID=UPI003C76FB2C
MAQDIHSLDGQINPVYIESTNSLSILLSELEECKNEAIRLESEFNSLYHDYRILISDIAIERVKILQKKSSDELKKLMDSVESIVKTFVDYASKNDLSAFDTAHFFATHIQSEESYFLKKRVIYLMINSGVLVIKNESYKLIGGEIIIPTSDSGAM